MSRVRAASWRSRTPKTHWKKTIRPIFSCIVLLYVSYLYYLYTCVFVTTVLALYNSRGVKIYFWFPFIFFPVCKLLTVQSMTFQSLVCFDSEPSKQINHQIFSMCMFWYMPRSVLLISAYSCHVNGLTSMNFYWDSFGSWHVDLRICVPIIVIKKCPDSADHWSLIIRIVLCCIFFPAYLSLLHNETLVEADIVKQIWAELPKHMSTPVAPLDEEMLSELAKVPAVVDGNLAQANDVYD